MNTQPDPTSSSTDTRTTATAMADDVAGVSPARYVITGIVVVLVLIALCVGGAYLLGAGLTSRAVSVPPTEVPNNQAQVSPTGGLTPGAPFSIQGAGFAANEAIEIFIGPAPDAPFSQFAKLGDAQADGNGAFTKDGLVAPANPGQQYLVAKGTASGYSQFTPVTVGGQPIDPNNTPNAPVLTPQPGGALPDLVLTSVRIELETGNSCAYATNQLGVRVDIQNAGSAPAGAFVLQINDQQTLIETGIAPGQIASRWLPGYSTGSNRIIIDPNNAIVESNRDNNRFDAPLPVPTLPPPCTPLPVTQPPPQPPPPNPGTATPNPDATGFWYGQYFGNQDLSGPVLFDQNFNTLSINWGGGAPGPNVPRNGWSAIFVRNENIPTTDNYQFSLTVDGGARVYIDNQLVRDEWFNGGLRQIAFSRGLAAGQHAIRVEYYKATTTARLGLSWKVGYTGWVGRYYNNPNREGQPVLKRDDTDINFDWGFGSPAPEINADNFSVDWQRSLNLIGGQYVFSFDVDDGVRLFVDNQLVLDSYNVQGNRVVSATRNLSSGAHSFQVQYVEYTGQAKIRFTYDRIVVPTPIPTALPTLGPTPTFIPVTIIVVTDTPVPSTAFPTLPPLPPTATLTPTLPPPTPTATSTPTPGGPPTETPTPGLLVPATIVIATP